MEGFENDWLSSYSGSTPRVWRRFVNDTFVIILTAEIERSTTHINQVDPCIKFTCETEKENQLPFLDTFVHRLEPGLLKFTLYRKPTHKDQYLDFSSHHPLQHKYSVTKTLLHRAKCIVSDPNDLKKEVPHIATAL